MTRSLPPRVPRGPGPRRPRRSAGAALLAVLALTACGERGEPLEPGSLSERDPTPFALALNRPADATHAGLFTARERGDFAEAGLAVDLRTPPDLAAPLRALEAGEVDMALIPQPELLLARDRGADLVAVGALVQEPLTSLISTGSDAVGDLRALAGKRVATGGRPFQQALLRGALAEAGVPPGQVALADVGFSVLPATVSDRVAGAFGAFWSTDGVALRRRGRDPVVLRVDEDLDVPTYSELVFVVRAQDARARGPVLRRLLQAAARGHRALREDPRLGVEALRAARPRLDPRVLTFTVNETLPLFSPDDEGLPFGHQDTRRWQRFASWMLDNRLLRRPPEAREALTNEFLPGLGLAPSEGPGA
ncbi:MAG TPA: ABC transporter substrate-binding protein [Solirubrobacteraceae bacterium]|nr:ABC transporter substrate-binding protein [Solirubrobacteraceae bacterium]